jgi:subtilisin family serine protease
MRRNQQGSTRRPRRRITNRSGIRRRDKARSRSLGFEPLEVRLPLAGGVATDITSDSMAWQGHEVEVQRGGWIVQVDRSEQSYPDILPLGPQVHGTDARMHAAAAQIGRRISSAGHYAFQFRHELPSELALEAFSRTPGFRYAEPDFVLSTSVIPDDPEFPKLWGLDQSADHDIDAPEAWDRTTGASSVVVGVIDSGVDYTHQDLAANLWTNPVECPAGPGTCLADGVDDDGNGFIDDFYGWDFFNGDNDPFDDHSHGTHVAGTVAAVGNNATGVTGVSWNAEIMALKFIGAGGSGPVSAAISAIEYATMMKRDHGVNIPITNNSWGGGDFSQAL